MESIRAARFVEENLRTIFAYALSRVPERADAEDLTNDIVLAILQSADKIRKEEAFYGYVWGIAALPVNEEYSRLFSRKLPGQILLSAYYTAMSVRELAIELGVGSVYLEDELALLERYRLISKTPAGKYQTSLVIFTEESRKEFWKKAEGFAVPALAEILSGMKDKLDEIRKCSRICRQLSDNCLLWGMLWPLMRQGHNRFKEAHLALQEKDGLYDGAAGVNYGIADEEYDTGRRVGDFAGYAGIDEKYYAAAADFSILPENNRYFEKWRDTGAFREKIYKAVSGEMQPEFMIVTEGEEKRIFEILSAETERKAQVHEQMFSCDCRIMEMHAPECVRSQAARIVLQTLIFRTVGLMGDCAVKSGLLALPDFEGPAVYVRENTKAAQEASLENRMRW